MTLIEFIVAGVVYVMKGFFILVALGVFMLVFVIIREAAWYTRQQNKKKLEEKKHEDDSI